MAVAHGRTSYQGDRKIRVGMTEQFDGLELEGQVDLRSRD
jgi:hypothetical protein